MPRFARANFLPILLALAAVAGCAQTPDQSPRADESEARPAPHQIETLAREFVQRHKLPGLSMGVVQGGKLAWHGGFTHETGAAPEENTLLRIGSVTKVVTAQAVLTLRDAGKLSLDDPVAKFIPETAGVLSAPGRPAVLVRHLLEHSSGIPSLSDGKLDWTKGPAVTEAVLVASVAACKLRFDAGSKFDYSNAGLALAGVVVARASGIPCRAYINAQLLRRLHMDATVWDAESAMVWPGHLKDGGKWVRAESYWNLGAIEPAGGLYSTVADVAKFVAFQLDPARNPTVLSAESVKQSHKPGSQGCGLGWMVGNDPKLGAIVWHNGSTLAHGAWVGFVPERGIGVVILLATGDLEVVGAADRLGVNAMRALAEFDPLPEPPPPQPTPESIVTTTVERLRNMLADPAKADFKGAFTADFLREIPEADLRKFFTDLAAALGKFDRHEIVDDHGHGEFMLRLHGSKGKVKAGVVAQLAAPHLMDGLWVEAD